MMKIMGERQLVCLGFTSSKRVIHQHYMVNLQQALWLLPTLVALMVFDAQATPHIVVSEPNNEAASIALSALVHALVMKNRICCVYFVLFYFLRMFSH